MLDRTTVQPLAHIISNQICYGNYKSKQYFVKIVCMMDHFSQKYEGVLFLFFTLYVCVCVCVCVC